MAALDSLIPNFDEDDTAPCLRVDMQKKYADSGLVEYSDDEMPAIEMDTPAVPSLPPLESEEDEDYGADIDTPPVEEEDDQKVDEVNTSSDTEHSVEEHELEKNPLEKIEINTCIYILFFMLGMITTVVITRMNSV